MTAIASAPAFGVPLDSRPENAAAIERGEHQIWNVDGQRLQHPSQNLSIIETRPDCYDRDPASATSHTIQRHVGQTHDDILQRLANEPAAQGAGGFTSIDVAQTSVDKTIADPHNQAVIAAFMHDPNAERVTLGHVPLGPVGLSLLRKQYEAGQREPIVNDTAHVDLIKDSSMATAGQDPLQTGYRIRTAWPENLTPSELSSITPQPKGLS